ncbi:MAG: hypothetical protein LBE24_02130 [Methylobacillus sp.]|jgi:hypothetical protein|nr:hypothetical protein [Methylobacillus sp.]
MPEKSRQIADLAEPTAKILMQNGVDSAGFVHMTELATKYGFEPLLANYRSP